MRGSPPTSGWNDVAISGPWRTATILPAAAPALGSSVTRASTSTPPPTDSTQGARMNTACTGSSSPAKSRSSSKESTCRPKALRRTVMSMPPSVSWPTTPSSIRSASRIMPAHVPKTGRPSAIRARNGSISSKIRASLAIVVDSPPGTTKPSHGGELGLPSYGDRSRAEVGKDAQVLADIPLEREDADHGRGNGRHARRLAGQPRCRN